MSDSHRRAEALMGEADRAEAGGDLETAKRSYIEAGRAEAQAFREIALDRLRTRGVVAVSSVALFRKGGDVASAIRQAHGLLSEEALTPESRVEIETMLDEMRTEAIAALSPISDGHLWALRGGRVGFGVARMDTVTLKIEQIQRFMWRLFEMLAGRHFRTTESVPEDVRAAVDLLVGQPVAGSFAFNVRVGEYQLTLDGGGSPTVQELNDSVGAILRAAGDEDPGPMEALVPDRQYRDFLLAMIRNMSPDGREVAEIAVQKLGAAEPPAMLTPVTRAAIRRRLAHKRPRRAEPQEVELRDVLRVIDLNQRKIALGPLEREQPCRVPDDIGLVDLIRGLEDRPVRVRGHWQGRQFVVHDIEPDYGDATTD
jgi:hypothetical protein